MNILVKRAAALGDVLSTTPIIARLRKENPDAFIGVETLYTNVFQGNLDVNGINIQRDWDRIIDLNMAHEVRRDVQAIEAYAEVAFDDFDMDKSIKFTKGFPPSASVLWKDTITIHANKSWPNRTMPNEWWDEVCLALSRDGYKIISLGTNIDYRPPNTIDTRNKLDLHQQAAVIDASRLFICGASGLFILAAATNTKVIVPLTINRPDTALPWRGGVQGGGYYPLIADVACLGCSERAGPVTDLGCEVGGYPCIPTVKAAHAVNLARQILDA